LNELHAPGAVAIREIVSQTEKSEAKMFVVQLEYISGFG